jgi:hypothetical protein
VNSFLFKTFLFFSPLYFTIKLKKHICTSYVNEKVFNSHFPLFAFFCIIIRIELNERSMAEKEKTFSLFFVAKALQKQLRVNYQAGA